MLPSAPRLGLELAVGIPRRADFGELTKDDARPEERTP